MIRFVALTTESVTAWRAGHPDAYGRTPERIPASPGAGTPCRHCLRQVPAGRPYLLLAHRPFGRPHTYAETGPIFVCADDCRRWGAAGVPPILDAPVYLLRGYDRHERIAADPGGPVETARLMTCADELLSRPDIGFLHIRSASHGCYLCRIQRA